MESELKLELELELLGPTTTSQVINKRTLIDKFHAATTTTTTNSTATGTESTRELLHQETKRVRD